MWRLSKAARELLAWNQAQAADAAGVSISALKAFEARQSASIGMVSALRLAYEAQGVEFVLSQDPSEVKYGVVRREGAEAVRSAPPKKTKA